MQINAGVLMNFSKKTQNICKCQKFCRNFDCYPKGAFRKYIRVLWDIYAEFPQRK